MSQICLIFSVIAIFCINKSTSQYDRKIPIKNPQKFPYAVEVNRFCGGTILNDQWVLTAAHCYRTRLHVKTLDGEVHEGLTFIKHPKYELGPEIVNGTIPKEVWAKYDFGLIKMRNKFQFNDKVFPISVGRAQVNTRARTATYAEVYANYLYEDEVLPALYEGQFQILPDEECKKKLPPFDAATMVCAAGFDPYNSIACYGDSGSGLVHRNHVVGITSWVQYDNVGCFNHTIAVYSRPSFVLDWIEQTINSGQPEIISNRL